MTMRPRSQVGEVFTMVTNDKGILSTTDDENYEEEDDVSTDEELTDKEEEPHNSEYVLSMPKMDVSSRSATPVTVPHDNNGRNSIVPDLPAYYDSYAEQFMTFMNQNPTTYHVVSHFKSVLENNGFTYIKENEIINLANKPGFYFTSKDDLTLIAFVIGGKWKPINGSCFIASHCDALSVKINPQNSKKINHESVDDSYELLGVAPYSGALNHLWLNRDLSLAGSILVKDHTTKKVTRKLINSFPNPIGFIPQLAPHFGLEEKEYNQQTEMVPIISYRSAQDSDLQPTDEEKSSNLYNKHSLGLLRYVTQLSQSSLSSIVSLDLDLVDAQPAIRGGLNQEFIYSSSLDDRLCSFDSIYGLIEYSQKFFQDGNSLEDYDGLNGIYLSNHEEIGSATRTGAKGGFLVDLFKSLASSNSASINGQEALSQLNTNSVLLSTDVTHALNPNFKDVYLEGNFPLPNVGPSIKFDSNMHVLSDSSAYVFLQDIITKNLPDIKLQHFHIRNDSRSGGTIGPILSDSQRGINGAKLIIDVGLPILSMHSIRSIMGYKDVGIGIRFFKEVFNNWQESVKVIE